MSCKHENVFFFFSFAQTGTTQTSVRCQRSATRTWTPTWQNSHGCTWTSSTAWALSVRFTPTWVNTPKRWGIKEHLDTWWRHFARFTGEIAVILIKTRMRAFIAIILSLQVVLNHFFWSRNDRKRSLYYSCQWSFSESGLLRDKWCQLCQVYGPVKETHKSGETRKLLRDSNSAHLRKLTTAHQQ